MWQGPIYWEVMLDEVFRDIVQVVQVVTMSSKSVMGFGEQSHKLRILFESGIFLKLFDNTSLEVILGA